MISYRTILLVQTTASPFLGEVEPQTTPWQACSNRRWISSWSFQLTVHIRPFVAFVFLIFIQAPLEPRGKRYSRRRPWSSVSRDWDPLHLGGTSSRSWFCQFLSSRRRVSGNHAWLGLSEAQHFVMSLWSALGCHEKRFPWVFGSLVCCSRGSNSFFPHRRTPHIMWYLLAVSTP